MSWRMDSTAGAAIWDTQPLSTSDLALRDEEIRWLCKHQRPWKLVNARIAEMGDPIANVGAYTSLGAYPPTAAQTSTAVTTATPGTTIWTVSIWTPILANSVVAGSGYRVAASGTIQTSTTSQTFNVLPSVGSGTVNAAPTTHHDLGVTGAFSVASTALTSIWYLQGDLTVRSVGTAGTAWFMGTFQAGLSATPVTTTVTALMGGTAATVDWTGVTASDPGGLQFSGFAASTITIVTNQVHWQSL